MKAGVTNGKISVDITARMATVMHEDEVVSLDQYCTMERGVYVNPDAETTRLIKPRNAHTVLGSRELYEVMG